MTTTASTPSATTSAPPPSNLGATAANFQQPDQRYDRHDRDGEDGDNRKVDMEIPVLQYSDWLGSATNAAKLSDNNEKEAEAEAEAERQRQQRRDVFVQELRRACHTIGFFVLHTGNAIPPTIRHKAFQETKQFFEHSTMEQKQEISYEHNSNFRGYMRLGVENTAGQVDYREQVEYAVEQPEYQQHHQEQLDKIQHPYDRLRGVNPWPDHYQPTLRPAVMDLIPYLCQIADDLRQALSMALGFPSTALDDIFGSIPCPNPLDNDDDHQQQQEPPHWVLKMVSYPEVDVAIGTDSETTSTANAKSPSVPVLGVGSHTDTNFITLILQQQQQQKQGGTGGGGGLQVFSHGQWHSIQLPPPRSASQKDDDDETNYIICNLGEQAQIWSRNYFLATPHRVLLDTTTAAAAPTKEKLNTTTTNSDQKHQQQSFSSSRISLPFFYNPRLSARITPIPNLWTLSQQQQTVSTTPAVSPPPPPWKRETMLHSWKRPPEDKQEHSVPQVQQQDLTPKDTQLSSVGENTFKSLARSHPVVFAKHHPDLQLLENGQIVKRSS